MFKVPSVCLPLLKEQRTHYKNPVAEYAQELQRTYLGMVPHLPEHADSILDIGCGMAGIDVFLSRRFHDAEIHLLDKDGVSESINAGFNAKAEDFAHYHDFGGAKILLAANRVPNRIVCHDMLREPFPEQEFDVVVSLLSWGFHYPIETYAPRCRGVMIVDVRRETDGEEKLGRMGDLTVIHESKKYRRVVVKC